MYAHHKEGDEGRNASGCLHGPPVERIIETGIIQRPRGLLRSAAGWTQANHLRSGHGTYWTICSHND